MESLVGYGSDDEGSEIYQENKKDDRGMNRMRPAEDDVNYDNVQMDMSEESNNNHSASSNDDDKSSTKSSSSSSSASSDSSEETEREERRKMLATDGKHGNGLSLTESSKIQDTEHKIEDHHKDEFSKDRMERDKRDVRSKERSRHDYKEKEHSKARDHVRKTKSGSKERERRSKSRSKERERITKSRSKERDRERRRSRSRDKGNRKRSRSPGDRHGSSRHRDEKSSHYKRSRSRDRERRSPGIQRQRSRSRDRGKSSSSSSGSSRRGSYEKKPSKLTILERLGIELRPPEASPAVTPQQLLQKSIEQQVQQVKSSTGIELPKYYNPAAMNPARYAEQMQKRRLLWGNKSQESKPEEAKVAAPVSNNKWEGTTFAQDQDGKMTAKFKRLMGIKDPGGSSSTGAGTASTNNPEGNEILKKQEELFNSMEMQYEVARVATHTHRGVGLGFGTFQYPR